MIAIDIEVSESSDFKSMGPGYHRKDGAIICVGLYDGNSFECLEPDDPKLGERLASDEDKVFHNSVYDTGWLTHGYGFSIGGVWHDTMTRACLIDEYAPLDLDSCCKRFNVAGKNIGDTIDAWYAKYKSELQLSGTIWNNLDILWHLPEGRKAMIDYNEQDCKATYNLFYAQEKHFDKYREAYELECKLQPVINILNRNGFPVDIVARDQFAEQIHGLLKESEEILKYEYGITSAILRSPKQLTTAMNGLGIYSPRTTATGAQSWNAEALAEIDHPVMEIIANTKKYNTLINNFLEGSLQRLTNGRAYSVFSPNKRDDGGTRTGRFGSRTINLQQIPARDSSSVGTKSYGTEMRSLFLPEEGCLLGSIDYSSIEMYGFAHFAIGQRSEIFKEQARQHADFHTMAKELSGLESRVWAKHLNFTVLYGAGPKTIFLKNKKAFETLEKTTEIYNKFHRGMPYIRATQQWVENLTRSMGYVTSIGGRVHHRPKPSYDKATGRWNDGLYKMLNSLIQGSCADTLKKGLVDAYEAGIFNVLTLHATVHDENVFSIPLTNEGWEATNELKNCMEQAYADRWTVPIRASLDVGPSWGQHIEDFNFKEYLNANA